MSGRWSPWREWTVGPSLPDGVRPGDLVEADVVVRPSGRHMDFARRAGRPAIIERVQFIVDSGASFLDRDPGSERWGALSCTHIVIRYRVWREEAEVARREREQAEV